MLSEGSAGADDVGDGVGNAELDGDFDGAVELDDFSGDAVLFAAAFCEVGVSGCDAFDLGKVV